MPPLRLVGPRPTGPQVADLMREFEALTIPSPVTTEERLYVLPKVPDREPGVVSIGLCPVGDTVRLVSITATAMGQGDGSRGLDWLCALADRHRVPVVGSAKPFGTRAGRLGARDLAAWYRRRGFSVGADGAMRRDPAPQVAAPATTKPRGR